MWIENINEYLDFGLNIAIIELCEDAIFYIEPDGKKFKTNKFIIKEILPQTEEHWLLAVRLNPYALKHITTQT